LSVAAESPDGHNNVVAPSLLPYTYLTF
jgi:hypothetical protein